jgi:hypothetical protein
VKIQRKSADYGYFELIVFQVAGQSAISEIDRVVHPVGDVAVADAARPVDLSPPSMRISHPDSTSGTAFRRLRTPRKTTMTVLCAPAPEKVRAWHAASNFRRH